MIGARETHQIFPADIGDEISKAIDVLNFANEFTACFMSPGHFETDACVDHRPEGFDRVAARGPRGDSDVVRRNVVAEVHYLGEWVDAEDNPLHAAHEHVGGAEVG